MNNVVILGNSSSLFSRSDVRQVVRAHDLFASNTNSNLALSYIFYTHSESRNLRLTQKTQVSVRKAQDWPCKLRSQSGKLRIGPEKHRIQSLGLTQKHSELTHKSSGFTHKKLRIDPQNLRTDPQNSGLSQENLGLAQKDSGFSQEISGLIQKNSGVVYHKTSGLTQKTSGVSQKNQNWLKKTWD